MIGFAVKMQVSFYVLIGSDFTVPNISDMLID